jgi:hypothetical protein
MTHPADHLPAVQPETAWVHHSKQRTVFVGFFFFFSSSFSLTHPETVAATVQPFGQPSSGDQSMAPGGMTASNVCTLLAHVSS